MAEEAKSSQPLDCWTEESDRLTVIPPVQTKKDSSGKWTAVTITGPCGDTMHIELNIENDRVVDSYFWGNGCVHSQACGCFAADAAIGKTVEEIPEISPEFIVANLKELPLEEGHCAQLAHDTLMQVVHEYLSKWRTSQKILKETTVRTV
jgi:NifU-like protein involved in Fe-S cluster formation